MKPKPAYIVVLGEETAPVDSWNERTQEFVTHDGAVTWKLDAVEAVLNSEYQIIPKGILTEEDVEEMFYPDKLYYLQGKDLNRAWAVGKRLSEGENLPGFVASYLGEKLRGALVQASDYEEGLL